MIELRWLLDSNKPAREKRKFEDWTLQYRVAVHVHGQILGMSEWLDVPYVSEEAKQ
jgi:hypothetical protein